MNKFIKKIVVPKSFLNDRHCAPVGSDATATAMARLEKDISGLLEDTVLEPTEKMKLYNQSMNCLLTYDRKQDPEPVDPFPDPLVPVEDPKEDLEDDLAINLPPSLRSKGQHLYQKLKGTLQWNDKGKILTEDNRPISGSHITDLINTAIRTQRKLPTLIKSYKRLIGRGPQFQLQEEVWKPEPESEPESESKWQPKPPKKKYKWESIQKGKHPLIFFNMTRETDHEGLLCLFTKHYKAHG